MPKNKTKRRKAKASKPTDKVATIHFRKDGGLHLTMTEDTKVVMAVQLSEDFRKIAFGGISKLGTSIPALGSMLGSLTGMPAMPAMPGFDGKAPSPVPSEQHQRMHDYLHGLCAWVDGMDQEELAEFE